MIKEHLMSAQLPAETWCQNVTIEYRLCFSLTEHKHIGPGNSYVSQYTLKVKSLQTSCMTTSEHAKGRKKNLGGSTRDNDGTPSCSDCQRLPCVAVVPSEKRIPKKC